MLVCRHSLIFGSDNPDFGTNYTFAARRLVKPGEPDGCPADIFWSTDGWTEDAATSDPCRRQSEAVDLMPLAGTWELVNGSESFPEQIFGIAEQLSPDAAVEISGSYGETCAIVGTAEPFNAFGALARYDMDVTGCVEYSQEWSGTMDYSESRDELRTGPSLNGGRY